MCVARGIPTTDSAFSTVCWFLRGELVHGAQVARSIPAYRLQLHDSIITVLK